MMAKSAQTVRDAARQRAQKKADEYLAQMSVEEQSLLVRYDSPKIDRLNIPEYNWWNEALHGVARAGTATVFPVPIALAASFDKDMLKQIGEVISLEGRAKYNCYIKQQDNDIFKGLTYWSPNINLFRDPRWGRGHETFGEDPYLTAMMGDAFICGIQGDDDNFLRAAACVKHFAAHSGPEALRHEFDAKVSEKDLRESYLPAFEYCVKHAQVEGVMGGYSSLNGSPLCGNYRLIEEILRKEWHFKGYYVSDCWALKDFHEGHKVTNTPEESAAMALKAGCDVNCGCCYLQLMSAYKQGLITAEEIKRAARRALTTRILLGLGKATPWDTLTYKDVDTPQSAQLNYKASASGMVLLKNNGILPISLSKLSAVGVIGPNADSTVVLQGNYHGTASHFVTVMEGMKRAVQGISPETRILYSAGSEIILPKAERLARDYDRIAEAKIICSESEAVILCVGLDERYEGEAHHISTGECIGGDKESLEFPECQKRLIEAVLSCGTPVILCCMAGSCIDLSPYEARCAAIIQAWYPGALGGQALADIITGRAAPTGKLPVTFYNSEYKIPDFTDYSLKNRTYRYVESGVLYPFGYGLTYGKTEMVSAKYMRPDKKVNFRIQNLSDVRVSEVVQVYQKNKASQNEVRNSSLCGFTRVTLEPKQVLCGEIELSPWAFTVVNQQGERIQDGSEYNLWVGTHGPDALSCELAGNAVIECHVDLN